MKKLISLFLVMMCVCVFTVSSFAEESGEPIDNVAETVSEEPLATNTKDAQETTDEKGSVSPDIADLVRFVPTKIDVTSYDVTVYGYFINMNGNYAVENFEKFEMDVYRKDDFLVSGTFGTIHRFTVEPYRMQYQSFTFSGDYGLTPGSYACDDRCYCVIGCSFTPVSR